MAVYMCGISMSLTVGLLLFSRIIQQQVMFCWPAKCPALSKSGLHVKYTWLWTLNKMSECNLFSEILYDASFHLKVQISLYVQYASDATVHAHSNRHVNDLLPMFLACLALNLVRS